MFGEVCFSCIGTFSIRKKVGLYSTFLAVLPATLFLCCGKFMSAEQEGTVPIHLPAWLFGRWPVPWQPWGLSGIEQDRAWFVLEVCWTWQFNTFHLSEAIEKQQKWHVRGVGSQTSSLLLPKNHCKQPLFMYKTKLPLWLLNWRMLLWLYFLREINTWCYITLITTGW